MQTAANRAADEVLAPTLGAPRPVTQLSVSAAAAAAGIAFPASTYPSPKHPPNGKTFMSFQAVGGDVYVAFRLSATPSSPGAATITTTTGWVIPAGTVAQFFIDPNELNVIEYIGTGTATLKYCASSRGFEGS